MNEYYKYCPNVWVLKTEKKYNKGETAIIKNRFGKENEHIVHNLVLNRGDYYYYSITRKDGLDTTVVAKKKEERVKKWQENAEKRAGEYYDKTKKDMGFLSLGEPIKVGHHSEKRHRKVIKEFERNMDNWIKEKEKAESYDDKIDYLKKKQKEINLSMPCSIKYFEEKVKELEAKYKLLKEDKSKRPYPAALDYARNHFKNAVKNLEIAKLLWE